MDSGKRVGNRAFPCFLLLFGLFVASGDLFFIPSFVFIFWRGGEGREGRSWVRMRVVKRDWGGNGCFGVFFSSGGES